MAELAAEKAREELFREALEQLETCAGTPLVSGEMVGWIEDLQDAALKLKPRLEQQIGEVHRAEFKQIRREDQFLALVDRLPILWQLAERIEPDEQRAERTAEEFAKNAIELVARIRKQEVAIRTWLMEAFTRDRGVVD
jgi:hypothetical protein